FLKAIEQEITYLDESPEAQPLAPLVLRPFLESYLVVADCLSALPPGARLDEKAFLRKCLGVGHQWLLQRRLHSAESVSLAIFRNGLEVARHRGLIGPGDSGLTARRGVFADEIRQTLRWMTSLERQGTVRPAAEGSEVRSGGDVSLTSE